MAVLIYTLIILFLILSGVFLISFYEYRTRSHLYRSFITTLVRLENRLIASNPAYRHLLFAKRWFETFYLYPFVKFFFRNEGMSIGLFSITVTMAVYLTVGLNELVLITTFYASFLFFREIFKENSIPRLSIRMISRGYGLDSHDENSNSYLEVSVGNTGTADIVDLNIEFKLYDATGRPLMDFWRGVEKHHEKIRTLSPGETTGYLKIPFGISDQFGSNEDGYQLADGREPRGPYYCIIRTSDKSTYTFLNAKTISIIA